jgi:2-oxoisovalerate dehydrogenase E1 component
MNTHTDNKTLIRAFELMYTSRSLDEKMMILIKQGKAYFHMSAAGHEAVQAAAALSLNQGKDWVYPYYRDQVLCLGMGMSIQDMMLGFLAKKDDPSSGGRQLPHHYGHKDFNIVSSSSSVGTQFLQAVGTSLANKELSNRENGRPDVTLVCGGEGSTSQGEFYEAINWASIDKLPIIFLIQNNDYAISVKSNIQKPEGDISVFGKLYDNLLSYKINGCNFIESFKFFNVAHKYAQHNGPVVIDANVVRLMPHSSSDDQKQYRSYNELGNITTNDPLLNLEDTIVTNNILTISEVNNIKDRINEDIEYNIDKAMQAEDPLPSSAVDHVYSDDSSDKNDSLQSLNLDETESFVFIDAINKALEEKMTSNENIYVFGEDVAGNKGGVFKATRNLTKMFGIRRCFNTQLAEASIVGVAIGMAVRGLKPVIEIQFGDYIWPAMMQIKNELSTFRYRSNGNFCCPLVIRIPVGGYIHGGLCHSQNVEALFAHIPGLRIVEPSNALDAYGLLKHAIDSQDPVLFLEHKFLYRQKIASSFLPKGDWSLAFDKAQIKKTGTNLTIISYGYMIYKILNAVTNIENKYNISVEVIDLVSLKPIDWETLFASIKKTNRCLIIHEANEFMGLGAEISAEIASQCFDYLDAPIKRHAGLETHIPFNSALEEEVLPQVSSIEKAIEEILSY